MVRGCMVPQEPRESLLRNSPYAVPACVGAVHGRRNVPASDMKSAGWSRLTLKNCSRSRAGRGSAAPPPCPLSPQAARGGTALARVGCAGWSIGCACSWSRSAPEQCVRVKDGFSRRMFYRIFRKVRCVSSSFRRRAKASTSLCRDAPRTSEKAPPRGEQKISTRRMPFCPNHGSA